MTSTITDPANALELVECGERGESQWSGPRNRLAPDATTCQLADTGTPPIRWFRHSLAGVSRRQGSGTARTPGRSFRLQNVSTTAVDVSECQRTLVNKRLPRKSHSIKDVDQKRNAINQLAVLLF